ncbi:MAG: aldehyde ferredoxin oxidoreductase family protein [Chloroflexi bacterium]|nr:aldehyde ferredoxin oxidoreductase family protein [Chloroflexota bacterium]
MRSSYNGRVLCVDLGTKKVWVETLPDFYLTEYLGGRGAAARLLWELTGPQTKPLGKNNVLIFSPGALTGTTAPASGRTTVTFKSPPTGGYFKSSVGGGIGLAIKQAGFDHILIRGKSASPAYIYVAVDRVEIRDASSVWGKAVKETNRLIKAECRNEELQIACIGPAGEHLCNFAAIMSTYYNAAARGGGGAVMGSKNLKALVVNPAGGKVYVADPGSYVRAVQKARDASLADSHAEKMKLFGTSTGTDMMVYAGLIPTYNSQRQYLKSGAENLTGQHLMDAGYLKRSVGCGACIFGCHRYTVINEGKFKGTYSEGPEYETFASLGAYLGITDSQVILKANELANDYGLDTISLGSVVGWAIECFEKGVLTTEHTAGRELRWEDGETLFFLIDAIVKQEGIGRLLAQGVRKAAEEVGQDSYQWAIQARGLEQSRVELRGAFSYALAFALNPRGPDHLTTETLAEFGTGYSKEAPGIVEKIVGDAKYALPYLFEKRAEIVTWHEDIYAVSDALGYCAFATTAAYGVDEEVLAETFKFGTGRDLSPEQIMKAGRRIVTLERCYNIREGWSRLCDVLPWRYLKEKAIDLAKTQPGPARLRKEDLDGMLSEYYRLNRWDALSGFPEKDLLEELGLGFTIPVLEERRATYQREIPASCRLP